MSKTRVNCPNCRQPIVADIEQLFDVGADPTAKQRLISGAVNVVKCPQCGYQGNLGILVVYHDPEKELLLTYAPMEVGLTRNDQERLIGSLINQAVSRLPPEKRKAYIFQPQTMLTMQGMVERILQADGITREMLQAQQQRLSLIQRLAGITDEDVRSEVIKQEDNLIDADFFSIFNRLAEGVQAGGDPQAAQRLKELQESLVTNSSFGKKLKEQSEEIQAAVKDIQSLGKDVTRDKILDLLVNAPTEIRLSAIASLVRPALDYEFFQILSERIDRARGDGRTRLVNLREKLLEITDEIDQQLKLRSAQAHALINRILQDKNPREAMLKNLGNVDDFFLQELDTILQAARIEGNQEQEARIKLVIGVIQEASTPPEMVFIQELLEAPNDAARLHLLEQFSNEVTPEFMNVLTNLASQVHNGEDKELAEAVMHLHRLVLRFSMQRQMQ